jgi:hypothetical protein
MIFEHVENLTQPLKYINRKTINNIPSEGRSSPSELENRRVPIAEIVSEKSDCPLFIDKKDDTELNNYIIIKSIDIIQNNNTKMTELIDTFENVNIEIREINKYIIDYKNTEIMELKKKILNKNTKIKQLSNIIKEHDNKIINLIK